MLEKEATNWAAPEQTNGENLRESGVVLESSHS